MVVLLPGLGPAPEVRADWLDTDASDLLLAELVGVALLLAELVGAALLLAELVGAALLLDELVGAALLLVELGGATKPDGPSMPNETEMDSAWS